jgi:hypothetical protein
MSADALSFFSDLMSVFKNGTMSVMCNVTSVSAFLDQWVESGDHENFAWEKCMERNEPQLMKMKTPEFGYELFATIIYSN